MVSGSLNTAALPVAIIGAGPIGLAAAAHLVSRGATPLVLEAGPAIGANIRRWAHVRLFSPWGYNVDRLARAMLEDAGWMAPDADVYPTGSDLVSRYLEPLADLPQIRPHLRLNAQVLAVARYGLDKMKTEGRDAAPFALHIRTGEDTEEVVLARAVIDASGTYGNPNPIGASGLPAPGETAASDHIFYGIPDVLGAHRKRYAGRRMLVVGGGDSAFNTLLSLAELAAAVLGTEITWAVRRPASTQSFGGGERDALPERGRLGAEVRQLVEQGSIRRVNGFKIARLTRTPDGLVVASEDAVLPAVDEVIAVTGFRPDFTPLRELRLSFDPAVESPVALAPMIDPNVHSCGTVRPHGAAELQHPEPDFYIVGMKSYGRAPTFLMLTGYEQVRSVAAAITGDWEAARSVELELPETGACTLDLAAGGSGCGEDPAACSPDTHGGGSGCATGQQFPTSCTQPTVRVSS